MQAYEHHEYMHRNLNMNDMKSCCGARSVTCKCAMLNVLYSGVLKGIFFYSYLQLRAFHFPSLIDNVECHCIFC